MEVTSESVREIFKGLENGNGAAFFGRVNAVTPSPLNTEPRQPCKGCLFNQTNGEACGRPNAFTVVVTKEDAE
jgi:hypothetical protein